MSHINQKPDYSIADGNHNFDAQQIDSNNAMIQVDYTDLEAEDVTLSLEQAISPGASFTQVPESLVTVNPAKTSHSWNLTGVARGIYIRVALTKGTAAAGTIDRISYLY